MSVRKQAEAYIGSTRTVILATVTGEGAPAIRTLAGFANDGLTIYLSTSKTAGKVEQVKANPHASLLFQQEGQELQEFRNVTLTGTIAKVCPKCGDEFERAVSLLGERNPRFKERAERKELDGTAILKFTPTKLKYLDFSKGVGPASVEEIKLDAQAETETTRAIG